jgi:hypothetical protein
MRDLSPVNTETVTNSFRAMDYMYYLDYTHYAMCRRAKVQKFIAGVRTDMNDVSPPNDGSASVDTTLPSRRTFNTSESDHSSSNTASDNNQQSESDSDIDMNIEVNENGKNDDYDDDTSDGGMPATEVRWEDPPLKVNDVHENFVVEADAEEDISVDGEKLKCKR